MSRSRGFILLLMVAPGYLMAQVCNSDVYATTPDYRFTDDGDGTVSDARTGLRWQRCPVGYTLNDNGTSLSSDDGCELQTSATFNWQGALQAAVDLNVAGGSAGFSDWRLPNVKELASIVEFKCYTPAINLNLFPDTAFDHHFWSSTTYNVTTTAATVDFDLGKNAWSYKDLAGFENYVRLVRGGN